MRVQLQEIADKVDYGVTASAVDSPVGPKFLRITDIQDGRVDWKSVPWCDCSDRANAASKLSAGDIVFARTGATTGKSYLIESCPDNAVFASYLIRLRLNNRADPSYISHFFQTQDYWSQISKSSRGVAQPGVNASKLKSLEVPLPPLEEQKRIAKILDAADALRAKRRESLAQLDALLQSTFLDLFGDPVSNPKGWKSYALGEIFDIARGGSPRPIQKYLTDSADGINWIMIGDTVEGSRYIASTKKKIKPEGLRKSRMVNPGDFLLTNSMSFGRPYIMKTSGCIHDGWLVLSPKRSDVLPEYFYNLLCTNALYAEFSRRASGAVVKNLNTSLVKGVSVALPPASLQEKFKDVVAFVETMKSRQVQHLQQLDALFYSLQQQAFSGEL
ncbi:MAG: restriction endonuclease subunit S [Alcanivorax sp.]|uniref:restriction endonuclease subunit S n=1 Tax=Alcanivorax sp. TaxID=1872427 RepID=UPI00262105C1|nr:restriction endonuclease subunit S [Alcanivorax sp.]MDF1723263.1 restriction endonuclease subunit S [Alcanivorax sp.]